MNFGVYQSLVAPMQGSCSAITRPLKTNLVVEFVWRHQWSASCGVGLACDRARARLTRDALVAQVARDHRLADQRHRLEQKLDDGFARPLRQRLRPVEDVR